MKTKTALLWVVAAVVLVALMYPRPPADGFSSTLQAGLSSGAVTAMTDPRLFCTLSKAFPAALTDKRSLLMYRTCFGIQHTSDLNVVDAFEEYRKTVGYYIDTLQINTNDFKDMNAAIERSLRQVHGANAGVKLRGPIYALVFQAPYYRDARPGVDNNVVHIQPFNVMEYKYQSSGLISEEEGWQDYQPKQGVFLVAYILYPMYDPTMRLRPLVPGGEAAAVHQCLQVFLSMSTSEKMCRMRCPSDQDHTCGCLNVPANGPLGDADPRYKTVCLGPSFSGDRQKVAPVSYGSMYRVNEASMATVDLFDPAHNFVDDCTRPPTG
jgi:hypothetical protein